MAAPAGTSRIQFGAVLYAKASDAVAAALEADTEHKLCLTPQDWRSGPHRRVVRIIAPFGGAEELQKQIEWSE